MVTLRQEFKQNSSNINHLNKRQQNFIKYYFETQSATQAALKAGYSPKQIDSQASQLMHNTKIRMAINKYKEEINNRVIVTYNDKINLLWGIAQRCSNPRITQRGDKLIEIDQTSLAIKAIEVLNQMQGHVAPQQNVQINVNSTIEKLKQCAIEYKDY